MPADRPLASQMLGPHDTAPPQASRHHPTAANPGLFLTREPIPMLGPLFVWFIFAVSCVGGLVRPHYGLLGYMGFVMLCPQWNWRFTLHPVNFDFQKYIAICTLIGFALAGFRGNRLRGGALFACCGLVAYLALSWLSAQQSVSPFLSDWFMGYIWKIVLMAVLACVMLDTQNKLIALLWVCTLAHGYNAYEINMDYFNRGYSYAALYGWGYNDNNLYSILSVPMTCISMALALGSRKIWQQALAGVIFLLQAHQLMLMESRGCMLGAMLAAGLLVIFMPKTRKNLTIVVVAVVLAGALAGPPVIEEFTSSFESEENRDSSAESRFTLWKAGFSLTLDSPVLGHGPYASQTQVWRYYPGLSAGGRKRLHNLFFEVSSGSGVPAFLGYMSFIALPWWLVLRRWRRHRQHLSQGSTTIALAVLAGIPGYCVSSMFSAGELLESCYILSAVGIAWSSIVPLSVPGPATPAWPSSSTIPSTTGPLGSSGYDPPLDASEPGSS